jgi:hypothetical protein
MEKVIVQILNETQNTQRLLVKNMKLKVLIGKVSILLWLERLNLITQYESNILLRI